jgi:TorA maturation chaperone TorD
MKPMNKKDREQFCLLLASLFSAPDQEMAEQIDQGHLYAFFKTYIKSWGGDIGILRGLLTLNPPGILLDELKGEYYRLFSDTGGERIPLVESFYKPWTIDPHCSLPFAAERGFLMGDSAVHLLTVYQQCGLEVADPFRGMPDHIIIELEFLSHLYQRANHGEIKMFIEDHLNWVDHLREKCKRANAHLFYTSLIDILDLFIKTEKKRLEKEGDGEKNIH